VKVLVTGATGFIGRHLVEQLVRQGRDVRCLVRKTSDISRLKRLGVELSYGDLLNRESLEAIVQDVSIIYHLAGEVYSAKKRDYAVVNINGTKNLLTCCVGKNIEKFIYVSTVGVMGASKDLLKETNSCRPIAPYAKSKLEAEKIILRFFKEHKIPCTILRPPVVYGCGQSSILNKICKFIKNGRIFVIGTGDNLRSLCHIDNLLQAIFLTEKNDRTRGEIFLISDRTTYTINEIIDILSKASKKAVSRVYLPGCISAVSKYLFSIFNLVGYNSMFLFTAMLASIDLGMDCSKAVNILKYNPQKDLRDEALNLMTHC